MATHFNIETLQEEVSDRMEQAIQAMKHNFDSIRTGKATPALVENLQVNYYGSNTPSMT